MKRSWTTILLVFAAAALAGWLWIDRDRITTSEKSRREGSVFSAWRREDLSRVEIVRPDETLVFERDPKNDGAWKLTKPREERADQAAVERLLTTLEFAVVVRKAGDSKIEAPRAHGAVVMGNLTFHYALGGTTPRPEGSGYFQVERQAQGVVSKDVVDALLANADTYRDRTLVPYLSTELAKFAVKRAGGGFTLDRMDERLLRVGEEGVLLSRVGADRVWGALAELRAESFLADADAERLTANPDLRIEMTPKDGRTMAELWIGGECPGFPSDVVMLRKSPTRSAGCVPKGALEALRSTPASLVETHPFTWRHDEMEDVRLEMVGGTGPKAIEFARKGTGFHLRSPEERDMTADEADAASELLSRMAWSTAYLVTRGDGAFSPVARARIRNGEREEVVEIGGPVADAHHVLRRVVDGARLEVTPAVVRRFTPRDSTLQPRTLLGDARRVNRINLRCGTAQDLTDDGAGLRLVDPPGYETDSGITSLVDALVRGKVDAWVADETGEAFGIQTGACRVALAFEGGKDPATVLFGGEGETGVYGRLEGSPHVFVAPKSLQQLASTIYVSRALLRVPDEAIGTVRVTTLGRPSFAADHDAVNRLFADRVLALGPPSIRPAALVIDVTTIDAGPPRRITCGPADADGTRACARDGVAATFEVGGARLAGISGEDGGALGVARDGGPR